MSRPAGPLTGAPPMIGLTPTTDADVDASTSAMPAIARIGPMEVTGFDGHTTTRSAPTIASRTPGAGWAAGAPSYSTRAAAPCGRSRTKYSWNVRRPSVVVTLVRTG